MPGSIGTPGQGELVLSSIQRRVDLVFERMLGSVSDSSANTASVANV